MNSEIENKNKTDKKNTEKLFGLTYIYVIIIGFIIALIYSYNISDIAKQTIPPPLPDSTKQADLSIQEAKVVPPVNINEISKPTPELISKGKELFETTCVSCHGADGKGDGPAATGLNPAPRNFTSKDGWVNGPTLSGIFHTVTEGIPGSAMIAYDNYTPAERFELAHYIRSAFVPDPPSDSQDDLAALDQTYNLSKGTEIPAQIPVEAAMRIIVEEGKEQAGQVYDAITKINRASGNAAANIFNKVTSDEVKALTVLTNTDEWKGDEEKFVDIIVNDVDWNGFNEKVFYLSKSDWSELYNFMSSNL